MQLVSPLSQIRYFWCWCSPLTMCTDHWNLHGTPKLVDAVATTTVSKHYNCVTLRHWYLGGGYPQSNQGSAPFWRCGGGPAEILRFFWYCCCHHRHCGWRIFCLPISACRTPHQSQGIIPHLSLSPKDFCIWHHSNDRECHNYQIYLWNFCHYNIWSPI